MVPGKGASTPTCPLGLPLGDFNCRPPWRFSSAGRKRITNAKSRVDAGAAGAADLRAWSRAYCTRKRLAADHAAASQLIPLECGSIAERSGPK